MASLVALVVSTLRPLGFVLVFPVAGTLLLFSVGLSRWLLAPRHFDRNDWSYGIYLYAFPLQQILVQRVGPLTPVGLFLLAAPLTALCTWLRWRYVESPFLRPEAPRPGDQQGVSPRTA